jgi:hypothetical protein
VLELRNRFQPRRNKSEIPLSFVREDVDKSMSGSTSLKADIQLWQEQMLEVMDLIMKKIIL